MLVKFVVLGLLLGAVFSWKYWYRLIRYQSSDLLYLFICILFCFAFFTLPTYFLRYEYRDAALLTLILFIISSACDAIWIAMSRQDVKRLLLPLIGLNALFFVLAYYLAYLFYAYC